ncbi:MAG TPA: hypothetical protein VFT50_14215 [Baekduia sp.]|nr:hypothetical protein [Baekduia sp.]
MTAITCMVTSCGDNEPPGIAYNNVVKSLPIGAKQSEVRDVLKRKPLESVPYYRGTTDGDVCEYYRGVHVHGLSYVEATGTMWRLCFRAGKLVVREPVCPVPWRPGEVSRYKQNNYRGDLRDCKL